MGRRLNGLSQLEAWAKDRYIDPGMLIVMKRYRVDVIVFRKLNVAAAVQVPSTSNKVFNQEDIYREIYGNYSSLSVEQNPDGTKPAPGTENVLFSAIFAIPPQSFVPFSDQYHSTPESTYAYTVDQRVLPNDYLIIQHNLPAQGGLRSKRVYKIEHEQAVGVTVQMFRKFIITPQIGLPEGAEGVLDG